MEREALKLALEALKEISRYATTPWEDEWCGELADETLTAINALAQPAQEPVATVQCIHGITIGYLEIMQPVGTKLYITPPQREWVDLTGNEWFNWWRVSKIADETEAEIDFADFITIALAVSAKLKEKNNG